MRGLFLVVAVAGLIACGGEDGGAGEGEEGARSLTGCLKLWKGPHVGSTRLKYVAARNPMVAKVEVRGGKCRVSFASKDGKVYGRYIEKPNITGAWTKEAESAPVKTGLKVVASANATVNADGSLSPGAP
jgi:hypothetical protein